MNRRMLIKLMAFCGILSAMGLSAKVYADENKQEDMSGSKFSNGSLYPEEQIIVNDWVLKRKDIK